MSVGVQPRRGGGRGRGRDRSLANSPPFPAAYRRLGSSVCGAATILQMLDREARGSLVLRALLARRFGGARERDRQWSGRSVPARGHGSPSQPRLRRRWDRAPCGRVWFTMTGGMPLSLLQLEKLRPKEVQKLVLGLAAAWSRALSPKSRAPSNPWEERGDFAK